MTYSKSIFELKRKALAMGLCGVYKGKWNDSTTPKELVDIASDVNGADFLCASAANGWGLSRDFLLNIFGDYINGKYISRQGLEDGYTSEIYIGYEGEITARTTVLVILYSNVTVHIPKNHACKIFAAGCSRVGIECYNYAELVDYGDIPRKGMKLLASGSRIVFTDPHKDASSWINFGGNEKQESHR